MKRSPLLIASMMLVAIACSKDEDKPVSKKELLTNNSSKSWNITDETPADLEPGCGPSSDGAKDNTWTFYADGKFTFDHGTVVEESESSCSDFINITGTWSFTDNESKLLIVAEKDTDNPDEVRDAETIFHADIKKLTKDALVLASSGTEATFSPK
jgi:hypothetical protein